MTMVTKQVLHVTTLSLKVILIIVIKKIQPIMTQIILITVQHRHSYVIM